MSAPTVTAKDLVLRRIGHKWALYAPDRPFPAVPLYAGASKIAGHSTWTRPDAADYADALRILSGRPRPDWIECWEAEDGTVWLVPEGEDVAIQVGEPESSMMEDCERYRRLGDGWEPSEYPSQCRARATVGLRSIAAHWSRLDGLTAFPSRSPLLLGHRLGPAARAYVYAPTPKGDEK